MDREVALLAAARKMNGDALTEIFELYAPALYKYAFRLSNNAVMADQLVGEVFEKFVRQLSAGKDPGVILRVFLYGIAYGIFTQDVQYTKYFWATEAVMSRQGNQWLTTAGIEEQKLLHAVQQALIHDLKEDQRHVVLLRFVEGFSLKETAAITGKKVNNVKVIQSRAIAALRRAIDTPVSETQTITILLRRLAQH